MSVECADVFIAVRVCRWSRAADAGLRALIARRGVAAMLLEVDFRNDWPLVETCVSRRRVCSWDALD